PGISSSSLRLFSPPRLRFSVVHPHRVFVFPSVVPQIGPATIIPAEPPRSRTTHAPRFRHRKPRPRPHSRVHPVCLSHRPPRRGSRRAGDHRPSLGSAAPADSPAADRLVGL